MRLLRKLRGRSWLIIHLCMPQVSCMQNFKCLACQEVPRLLQVFDASLKEAKGTFPTPERMTLIYFSSLMIYLCLKEAGCKISNSQLVSKCSGLKYAHFVNIVICATLLLTFRVRSLLNTIKGCIRKHIEKALLFSLCIWHFDIWLLK